MDKSRIPALVQSFVHDSVGYRASDIAKQRETAIEYYYGKPFGNEVDGRSSVVLTTVADTIEWIMPSLLKVFTAGDKVVTFDPVGPEDVPAAEQETDAVNHVWMHKNPGFLIFHDWFKDALLQKVGVIKVWWDEYTSAEEERYEGLTEIELQKLESDEEIEIIEKTAAETQAVDPMTGAPMMQATYSVLARRKKEIGKVCIENVPPEEFLISRQSKTVADAAFVAHRVKRTVSQLIEAGYDPAQVKELPGDDAAEYDSERVARHSYDEMDSPTDEPGDPSTREIWVYEAYFRADLNDDGIAELVKATCAGPGFEVLKWKDGKKEDVEAVSRAPFHTVCPIKMPHKLFGLSIADMVMDLQLIFSTLMRQMLDNLYLTNNPEREVVVDQVNLDDLLVSKPGGVKRVKQPGMIRDLAVPFTAGAALPVMEYLETVRENRTGVTRYNQGLDANALNKTASGISQIMSAAQERLGLIARVFAETGVKDAFLHIHELLRKHSSEQMMMRLRNQFVPVDPRSWKNRYDMTVSVGLGTGNKQEMLMHLQSILGMQVKAVEFQGGAQGPLVTAKNLFNTASKIVENSGLKTVDLYFTDPDQAPPQQPKPNPEVEKAQAELQIEREKATAQVQIDREKAGMDAEVARYKAQLDADVARYKAEMDAQIKLEVAKIEANLKATMAALQPAPDTSNLSGGMPA